MKQNQIKHSVLNAKHHAQEAEIIAQAGQKDAVTVATNMAGRGTDIKLKEDVAALGGLHVIGTTRHQSRRIDRQLRGRSARLGDPGSSKFYISFEDPLMRLFASPKLNALIQRFRPPEGEPISASILNRSIETAQKRVESRNYMMRKYTLEYDDVMNKQRQEVYDFRNEVLKAEDMMPLAQDLLHQVCHAKATEFFTSATQEGGWDTQGYRQWLLMFFPISLSEDIFDNDRLTLEQVEEITVSKVIEAFEHKVSYEKGRAQQYNSKVSPDLMVQDAIRSVMVQKIDELWQEHLLLMDYLRSEVNLRAVAQKDPLIEFKHEAFRLFHALTVRLHTDVARNLFKIEIAPVLQQSLFQQMLGQIQLETNRLIFDGMDTLPEQEQSEDKITPSQTVQNIAPKVGRNDDCPCKSGKKYKRCCGLAENLDVSSV